MDPCRDERGRWKKGVSHPRTAEHNRALSETMRARARQIKEQEGPLPDKKKCNTCEIWKRVPEDFYMHKRHLKSGGVTLHPSFECKKCSRQKQKDHRAKLSQEERAERQRRYHVTWYNKNAEEAKRKGRERQRTYREKHGIEARGGWVKYRETDRTDLVDPALFMEWLYWKKPSLSESEIRRINDVKNGRSKRISIRTVDRIMTRAGDHDQVAVFYPPPEQESEAA